MAGWLAARAGLPQDSRRKLLHRPAEAQHGQSEIFGDRDNELVRKRLAKLMALRCFRNTKLEDLHAGIYPSSEVGDYSDVKVVTPFGEIAWSKVSRLSDEE